MNDIIRKKIVEIEWKTPEVYELVIERDGMRFTPGDSIAVFNANDSESRPYSIASGLNESVIRLLIQKISDGQVSAYLSTLKSGDTIGISEPFGWFAPGQNIDGNPFVFIATGTGIAPFISYLRSFPDSPPRHCLYGIRELTHALELDLLQRSCNVQLAVSRENGHPYHNGRVTDLLQSVVTDPDTHYYLCGLDAMIDEVSMRLEQASVDFMKIHREVFFYASS